MTNNLCIGTMVSFDFNELVSIAKFQRITSLIDSTFFIKLNFRNSNYTEINFDNRNKMDEEYIKIIKQWELIKYPLKEVKPFLSDLQKLENVLKQIGIKFRIVKEEFTDILYLENDCNYLFDKSGKFDQ